MRHTEKMIDTEKIVTRDDFYPRVGVDWHTAYEYQEALRAGANFPPIAVVADGGAYVLIDGAHRLKAYKGAKRAQIEAEILSLPRDKWLEEAVRRNTTNARRFSVQEKVRIFDLLHQAGYSYGRIAEITFTPIVSIKKMLADRVVRGVILKGPMLAAGRRNPHKASVAQLILAARSQLNLIEQTLAIVPWLDMDDAAVVEAALRLRDALGAIKFPSTPPVRAAS